MKKWPLGLDIGTTPFSDYRKSLPRHTKRKYKTRQMADVKYLVFHQAQSTSTINDLAKYCVTPGGENHLSKRGAPAFPYTMAIDYDGEVLLCNPASKVTWANNRKGRGCRKKANINLPYMANMNKASFSVMVRGDFSGPSHKGPETPTDEQILSTLVLSFILREEGVIRDYNHVLGHCHINKESCPGFDIQELIEKAIWGKSPMAMRLMMEGVLDSPKLHPDMARLLSNYIITVSSTECIYDFYDGWIKDFTLAIGFCVDLLEKVKKGEVPEGEAMAKCAKAMASVIYK